MRFGLFQLHKSVGLTILLFSLARLGWRLMNRPPHVDQPPWEAAAARIVHFAFYVILIGLPLTGWMIVSTSPTNIPTLFWGAFVWPHLPGLGELTTAAKHVWNQNAQFGHESLVKVTYLLLFLHLGAVAKHQLFDKDAVFGHMAAGARPGWGEPRLWLAALAFTAVIGAGFAIQPARPKSAPPPPAPAPAEVAPVAALPAANAAPAKLAEAPEPPVAWTVAKGSSLGFSTSWSGQPVQGRFERWTADILFSPTALDKSHLKVEVDLASIGTGDAQRDSSLVGDDWFAIAAHPKATFSASRFRKTGEGRFVADGTLDLRGVKKPLSLPFSLKIDGKTAHARGSVGLDRTAFGVGQGEWAATDSVPAAVKVEVEVVAVRK
jgi:polyisoprenoid-binding protein YceI/cytochrome b561